MNVRELLTVVGIRIVVETRKMRQLTMWISNCKLIKNVIIFLNGSDCLKSVEDWNGKLSRILLALCYKSAICALQRNYFTMYMNNIFWSKKKCFSPCNTIKFLWKSTSILAKKFLVSNCVYKVLCQCLHYLYSIVYRIFIVFRKLLAALQWTIISRTEARRKSLLVSTAVAFYIPMKSR